MKREQTLDSPAHPDSFWLSVGVRTLLVILLVRLAFAPALVGWRVLGLGPPNDPPQLIAAAPALHAPAIVTSTVAKGVGSPYAGTVETLEVRKGPAVTRGQLLFRMEVRPLQQRLDALSEITRQASAEAEEARGERDDALAGLTAMLADVRVQLAFGQQREAVALALVILNDAEPLAALQDRERVLAALLRERRREWDQRIAAALTRKREATSETAQLRRLIRQSKRYSPIDGVVTSVRAAAGDWVKGAMPVVRIDDPRGYRIVMLVRNRSRAVPEVGAELRVKSQAGSMRTRVSRVVPGWDREVLSTWVWLMPTEPAELTPGQKLEAVLTRAPDSRTADARGGAPS